MIVDGRKIAGELKAVLKAAVAKEAVTPTLCVFMVDGDLATEKFVALKKVFAEDIGIPVRIQSYIGSDVTTDALIADINRAAAQGSGIIVQFPLPAHIDKEVVRNAIPKSHDVDVIGSDAYAAFEKEGTVLPPVVGAVKEVLARSRISLADKRVVVVGEGWLVGKPAADWARHEGAEVTVLNSDSKDISSETKQADVLILGAGSPGLITPEMVKEGAVILDAGTSEAKGKLSGDADPRCSEKASVFTPVPGGIGPITVAMIFKNLLLLAGNIKQ